MHLTYTGNGRYANAAKSYREDGKIKKSYIHLGVVVDKEKGVYDHKEIGLVGFDLVKEEFTRVPLSDAPRPMVEEKLILDFGDSYFLDWYIRSKGFMDCINTLTVTEPDTVRALVIFYITSGEAVNHAQEWYSGNYARILYPNANMDGRRISEFFEEIGQEYNYRSFFGAYIPLVTKGKENVNVIIDSTGLPNDIHMPDTSISNHNGDISNEVRLIVVMDKDQNMPIFMRYVPGNIVDSSTLIRTMKELEQQGVKCSYALMDAGYPTETNIRDLYSSGVGFMARLDSGSNLYKGLIEETMSNIMNRQNFTMYGDRRLFIKKVQCDLAKGCPGYAYCILDVDRKNQEDSKLAKKALKNGLTDGEAFDSMSKTGFFVIMSTMDLENFEVLPNYYVRQNVEQFLDIGKGSASFLPLRVHSEDTFRGHLLIAFIAAAVVQSLQNDLSEYGKVKKQGPEKRAGNKSPNLISALMDLRNQKCKVYDEVILPREPQSKANAVYNAFGLTVPYAVPKK